MYIFITNFVFIIKIQYKPTTIKNAKNAEQYKNKIESDASSQK